MDKRERHAELVRQRDALAALFDFVKLEGMILAYEEMIGAEDASGQAAPERGVSAGADGGTESEGQEVTRRKR